MPENIQKNILSIAGGAIAIVLIALLVWYALSGLSKSSGTSPTASNTTTSVGGVSITTTGSSTINIISSGASSMTEPSLTREFTPPSSDTSLTPDIVASIDSNISATEAGLKINTKQIDAWITLGLYRKEIDDYQGALADFQYAAYLSPTDPVALGDIADLYANFLSPTTANYQLAVTYYDKAIVASPSSGNLYQGLYEVYRFKLNDLTDAKATLAKGIAAQAQGYQDLQATLNSLPQ